MMMKKIKKEIFRRDFLKGLVALPFLGYFAFGFRNSIAKELSKQSQDHSRVLGLDRLKAPLTKLLPPSSSNSNKIRIGIVGMGWRGEQLLRTLGYLHPEKIARCLVNGKYDDSINKLIEQENLYVEITGICDTFSVYAERGGTISENKFSNKGANNKSKRAKIFPTYREMIASNDIDAIIIATPDHWHAQIAIDAAKAGKHVYLEKPMTHSIEEAVELKKTVKDTGIVFQLGHENRQQMSFKIAGELYEKGILGDVSMVQTYTNRNSAHGAWIRNKTFNEQANLKTVNWKEFLGNTPWQEFNKKRYFNWQRYSEYGTSIVGNDFSHHFDCVNQVLNLGIPESVIAQGGQFYYKNHGDMPDIYNAVFLYPKRGLTLSYDGTLKNGIYRETYVMGSEASMGIDRGLTLYKDPSSGKFKNIDVEPSNPLYVYAPGSNVDAVSSATSQAYIKGGYGSTFIDGKVIDATFLHLKEWIDAIRNQGNTSCNIDVGFEEAVTFNMANLAYENKKTVVWDPINEKAILA